jgi:predicted SprT family Zn-dependent metalloprotease
MTTPTMTPPPRARLNVDCFEATRADAEWIEHEARYLIGYYLGHGNWTFAWDERGSSWGRCHYLTRTITLSRRLMVGVTPCTRGEVRQTLLHEIAHAMTPGCKHNRTWKIKALSLGHPNPTANSNYTADPGDYKWALWCTKCNKVVGRRYRRTDMTNRHHRNCGGGLYWEAL